MVWFWGTPIIYSIRQVSDRLARSHFGNLPYFNPFTSVSLAFQRALYNRAVTHGKGQTTNILPAHAGYGFYVGLLAIVAAVSVMLLLLTARLFRRLEGDFAEAL
jgi:ABC-type polysaccharide/polyol phosphate export permease